MEKDESPREAARREANEEIGLDATVGRLLVIDYKSPSEERPACVQFVFDGGVLTDRQLSAIVLQANEIEAWRAVSRDEAVSMVAQDGPSSRLSHALAALDSGVPTYLEDGQGV